MSHSNSNNGELKNKKCKKCNKNGCPEDSCDLEYAKNLEAALRALQLNVPSTSYMEYCPLCEERGHDMYNCELFLKAEKEQKDYDRKHSKKKSKENNKKDQDNSKDIKCSKYKNGHVEDSCHSSEKPEKKQEKGSPKGNSDKRSEKQSTTSKKTLPEFKKIFFPMNQKSIYLSKNGKFLKICNVHCICEMCHSKYSSKLNKNTKEDHTTDKGPDDDAVRCCFMCGANGLIDSCFWEKPSSA